MPRVLRDLPGGVVEWLMALVLKTSVPKGTVGSNPTPSVEIESWDDHKDLNILFQFYFLMDNALDDLKMRQPQGD